MTIHGYQSGHGDDDKTLRWMTEGPPAREWSIEPIRPFINLEPPYEFHVAQLNAQGPTSENLLERAVSTFERNFIIRALEKSGWNVTATARTLGIPLSTLKFKMDRLEIRELARKIRGN